MERRNRIPNTRLSKWYDQADFDLDVGIGDDIVNEDSNFRLILYRIDRVNTNYDDVYGETKKDQIIYLPPVELNVLLTLEQAVNKAYNQNGTLRTSNFGNLDFIVYLNELKRKNVDITYGDTMVSEFTIDSPNRVTPFHYTSVDSLLDSETKFSFSDESIKDLVEFFNRFSDDFKLTPKYFVFLDSDDDSFIPTHFRV